MLLRMLKFSFSLAPAGLIETKVSIGWCVKHVAYRPAFRLKDSRYGHSPDAQFGDGSGVDLRH